MDNNFKIVLLIQQAISLFSDSWKKEYGLFFHTEHLFRFVEFSRKGFKDGFPDYSLQSSFTTVIPIYSAQVLALKRSYGAIESVNYKVNASGKKQLQEAIEGLPFSTVLLVMGQRLSSTSITTSNALPPLVEVLHTACFKPYNNQMSIAVRAWEKHAERSSDRFWPERKGNAKQKEVLVTTLVSQFFNQWQWWNVYSHQKHDTVFEIRIESGHGMRWTADGQHFIGFLEPFIEMN